MNRRVDLEIAGQLFVDVTGIVIICRDGTVDSFSQRLAAQFAKILRGQADFIEAHPEGRAELVEP